MTSWRPTKGIIEDAVVGKTGQPFWFWLRQVGCFVVKKDKDMNTKKHLQQNNGFTLLELIIVLVIMAIVFAVAARVMDSTAEGTRFKATMDEMITIRKALVGDESFS